MVEGPQREDPREKIIPPDNGKSKQEIEQDDSTWSKIRSIIQAEQPELLDKLPKNTSGNVLILEAIRLSNRKIQDKIIKLALEETAKVELSSGIIGIAELARDMTNIDEFNENWFKSQYDNMLEQGRFSDACAIARNMRDPQRRASILGEDSAKTQTPIDWEAEYKKTFELNARDLMIKMGTSDDLHPEMILNLYFQEMTEDPTCNRQLLKDIAVALIERLRKKDLLKGLKGENALEYAEKAGMPKDYIDNLRKEVSSPTLKDKLKDLFAG